MIPTALWFTCGMAASVLATVRVQLEILSRYPQADWLALAGGTGFLINPVIIP